MLATAAVRGPASTQLTAQDVASYDMQQVEQHAIDADPDLMMRIFCSSFRTRDTGRI